MNVDRSILSPEAARFVDEIVNPRTGQLYVSRPRSKSGDAQYVWRLVAFHVSANPRHQCMPVTADFYLGCGSWAETRARSKELDSLVDEIVDAVPMSEWYGARRWGRALGVL